MATEVNNLCPACGQYYSGTHDCPAVVKEGQPPHPLFDTAPLAEKLDAKVEEIKATLDPISVLVANAKDALTYQVGGSHYNTKAIQPIEYIHANGLGFIEGSIVKYITRWKDKGGQDDLKKIMQYTLQLIALEQKK